MESEELKSVQATIFDLCIALIKDLRHEMYLDFFNQMLPSAIKVLDAENLETMDKIFQLLSFAFKFLIKPIRENINAVFSVYIMLLEHKSRFVRKFSAQSFSYVLRKIDIDEAFVSFTLGFLDTDENVNDRINGLSDLLFEVISGHGDELHSKGMSMLQEFLKTEKVSTSLSC